VLFAPEVKRMSVTRGRVPSSASLAKRGEGGRIQPDKRRGKKYSTMNFIFSETPTDLLHEGGKANLEMAGWNRKKGGAPSPQNGKGLPFPLRNPKNLLEKERKKGEREGHPEERRRKGGRWQPRYGP